MNLREGDRIVLLKDASETLVKGTKGTVVSYRLLGEYEIKFDNGEAIVMNKTYVTKVKK